MADNFDLALSFLFLKSIFVKKVGKKETRRNWNIAILVQIIIELTWFERDIEI